jgi:aspartyl-tRNA(Asn)/glutamyl-tRNA(Gln) amidotransferase subunit C
MTTTETTESKAEPMDVAYVAHLARLQVTDEETALFQGQLNHILDYVQSLRALDTSAVEPMAHAVPVHNVFREDVPTPSLDHERVMANAPLERQGLFAVPKIIE